MAPRVGALGSLVLHALAAGGLWLVPGVALRLTNPAETGGAPIPIALSVVPPSASSKIPGLSVELPLGPADFVTSAPMSPAPRADVDIPEPQRAALGGGASGAASAWTGRHDREELRVQPWNDPFAYRIPRVRTASARATGEALNRLPEPGLAASERERTRRVRRAAAPGRPQAGAGGRESALVRAVFGELGTEPTRPFVARGPKAVEAAEHAPVQDNAAAAQASDERHPEPFDLTMARGGGNASGVSGPHSALGPSASEHGRGDGGTPLDVPAGAGQAATRARLQDAYFRALHARVMARVKWPPALAMAFEQGEVLVDFTLNRDGAVVEIRVARPSHFTEFDEAVVTAIRAAAPFGPVPAAVASTATGGVRVNTPFLFDNPLIR